MKQKRITFVFNSYKHRLILIIEHLVNYYRNLKFRASMLSRVYAGRLTSMYIYIYIDNFEYKLYIFKLPSIEKSTKML